MGERAPSERALVVGLGRSGAAAVHSLLAAGVEVVATDARTDVAGAGALRHGGAAVRLGVDGAALLELLDDVDLVVPSPGVSERAPVLRRAQDLGLRVWSEPELGWRLHPCQVVAITGTNGKTSVTELAAAMLAADGRDAVACGNIGHPFTVAARQAGRDTVLVAELSSFQLRYAWTLRAHVGVLLNLAPDHLDWHADADAYAAAKTRVWQAQQVGDWAVGNLEDPPSAALVRSHAPQATAWFSHLRTPATGVGPRDGVLVARLPERDGPIVPVAALPSRAPHHVANVAAAACAALLAGTGTPAVAEAVQGWRPGRHRLEVVATAGGVTWLDDSKATNPHAAAAALRAFPPRDSPRVVWIAGGRAKGLDLTDLASDLGAVRHAVLIGEAAEDLAAVVASGGVPFTHAATIEEAVTVAARVARSGDTVLLAPACASFDQFRDYAERGERFAAAARALTGAGARS